MKVLETQTQISFGTPVLSPREGYLSRFFTYLLGGLVAMK